MRWLELTARDGAQQRELSLASRALELCGRHLKRHEHQASSSLSSRTSIILLHLADPRSSFLHRHTPFQTCRFTQRARASSSAPRDSHSLITPSLSHSSLQVPRPRRLAFRFLVLRQQQSERSLEQRWIRASPCALSASPRSTSADKISSRYPAEAQALQHGQDGVVQRLPQGQGKGPWPSRPSRTVAFST